MSLRFGGTKTQQPTQWSGSFHLFFANVPVKLFCDGTLPTRVLSAHSRQKFVQLIGASDRTGFRRWGNSRPLGVLFGCLGRKIDGLGLPGGLTIYQGHLFPLKGHL